MNRYLANNFRRPVDDSIHTAFAFDDVRDLHRSLVEYQTTTLHQLDGLAESLGVGKIFVKDESERLGLKAFKVLGASYAIYRFVKAWLETQNRSVPPAHEFYGGEALRLLESGQFTFCTATDGNHGRAVAFIARRLKQRAEIFVPKETARARRDAIVDEGATVTVVDGDYDDAVRQAATAANDNGWQIISDTSWENYEEIPRWIVAGYSTLFEEIHEQPHVPVQIDLVIVPVGVGALAAAAAWQYREQQAGPLPFLLGVEPLSADCLRQSLAHPDGIMSPTEGALDSAMAGLNCGTLSQVAWPIIRDRFDGTIAIDDSYCFEAMRKFYYPARPDPRITSGESGASGLAALIALMSQAELDIVGSRPKIDRDTTVLIFNTEGDTDPIGFRFALRNRG